MNSKLSPTICVAFYTKTSQASLRKVNFEFVEERPELTDEEKLAVEKQKSLGNAPIPEAATKCEDDHHGNSHGHSHSHFGFGGHNHKH